jgi:hypothetical protein
MRKGKVVVVAGTSPALRSSNIFIVFDEAREVRFAVGQKRLPYSSRARHSHFAVGAVEGDGGFW